MISFPLQRTVRVAVGRHRLLDQRHPGPGLHPAHPEAEAGTGFGQKVRAEVRIGLESPKDFRTYFCARSDDVAAHQVDLGCSHRNHPVDVFWCVFRLLNTVKSMMNSL